MIRLCSPPCISPIEIKGENTKDVAVGLIVLLIRLVNPKTPPRNAPFFGPIIREPTITGIWIIVALVNPRGI